MTKARYLRSIIVAYKGEKYKNYGFTLVEMLIVFAIMGLLSIALMFNFRASAKNQAALQRGALTMVAAIRQAQTLAVSSSRFGGEPPCGYGMHYESPILAVIYFGSRPGPSDSCGTQNKNFSDPPDKRVNNIRFTDPNLEFKSSFSDIFFEPPDPKTYLNNDSSLTLAPVNIVIGFIGSDCSVSPSACKTIQVFTSGRIEN